MAVRAIVRFPDARLKLAARPVTAFDADLRALASDLIDTMRAAPGVGITAPHVGVPARLVVLELPGDVAPKAYVNPRLAWTSADMLSGPEGSVSMPGVTETITRARGVRIVYHDLDGSEQVEEAEGFRAVCHQHEIDQIDGIFWIQRLSALRRDRLVARYRKLSRRS